MSHGFLVVLILLMPLVSSVTLGKPFDLSGPLLGQADHKAAFVLSLSMIMYWVGIRVKADRKNLVWGRFFFFFFATLVPYFIIQLHVEKWHLNFYMDTSCLNSMSFHVTLHLLAPSSWGGGTVRSVLDA